MSPCALMLREMRLRWLNFALALLAVAGAAALVVALASMGRAANVETKRLMRNLGFNLLVLPGQADLAQYWATDTVKGDMPQSYVQKLAQTQGIGADHYVATLQQRLDWRGLQVVLTGILPERNAVDAGDKAPMGYSVGPGECFIGYAIAKALGLKEGQEIEIAGVRLKIARCMVEDASKEDVRIYTHLMDAQKILKMPDRINTIQALGCLCRGGELEILRGRIAKVLPNTYVTELQNIATARAQTRHMVEQNAGVVVSTVVLTAALWVALLAWLNVRERRQEIGVMRALGFGSGHVAVMFLGRALLIGAVGALLGFAVGTWLAGQYGADVFKLTFAKVKPAMDLLPRTVLGAVLITALASLLPAMIAVTQDPARTLTEE
ncbi:MAG: FtsX-like permease family protein [Armatimonadetes bacterium]|nr:FtsX-like permease family protein [Armatimonadota bacterium]